MAEYAGFKELGARILQTWNEGVTGLRDKRAYSLPQWNPGVAFEGFSDVERRQVRPQRSS
jgi:serine/threonine-protein kinase HipA